MQILYIIGNGFDLNLGLKTSYNDFYEYYKKVKSDNVNVQKLKENISKTYDSWADLELALGNYTQHLEKIEEFDDILVDIGQELSNYLHKEELKLESHEIDQKKFFEYLSFPERLFLPADKEDILGIKRKWASHHWALNIFTLNYTSIIEKIFGNKQKNVLLANHTTTATIKLGEIKHIHGYLDNDMVIGVNDISQIKNESFHQNRDVLESIVKTECNRANRSNIDRQFTSKINSANLICIFGSSIGDTDNKWWELIGERLKSDCHLIIFTKGAEIPTRIRHMQARAERNLRDLFLNKTNLSEKEMETVESKIYIGLNTGMFDGIMKQKEE
ncbi:AbiH family protein [uncultured Winogradskyella sp.]|uniref:AbiH family protein n=1 Tax=uncultured Winogradskyella sp. TaxID=395353 RepID=UPI0030EE47E0|tara:strand:+ start:4293 stop:5285 length:993 start_codon:yes stop_codon:yes gene_type:complete